MTLCWSAQLPAHFSVRCLRAKTAGWTGSPSGLHRRKCPRLQWSRAGPSQPAQTRASALVSTVTAFSLCPASAFPLCHSCGTSLLSFLVPLSCPCYLSPVRVWLPSLLPLGTAPFQMLLTAVCLCSLSSLSEPPVYRAKPCILACPRRCSCEPIRKAWAWEHRKGLLQVIGCDPTQISYAPTSPAAFYQKYLHFSLRAVLSPRHANTMHTIDQEAGECPPGISLRADDGSL